MAVDEVFKALADPTRRRILRLLSKGELPAGAIGEQFPISGPSLSHHFNVLKQADLIRGRREGQQIIYSINTTVVQDAMTLFLDVFAKESSPVESPVETTDDH